MTSPLISSPFAISGTASAKPVRPNRWPNRSRPNPGWGGPCRCLPGLAIAIAHKATRKNYRIGKATAHASPRHGGRRPTIHVLRGSYDVSHGWRSCARHDGVLASVSLLERSFLRVAQVVPLRDRLGFLGTSTILHPEGAMERRHTCVSITAAERSAPTETAHSQHVLQQYQQPEVGQFAWHQPLQSRGRRSVP